VPKNKEKEKMKKKCQQTPLVTSSGCFFNFLSAGLRNQRTGSEEPLVSVISQAQRTCSFSWQSQQRTADFWVVLSLFHPTVSLCRWPKCEHTEGSTDLSFQTQILQFV
jgi:hypothetical protein